MMTRMILVAASVIDFRARRARLVRGACGDSVAVRGNVALVGSALSSPGLYVVDLRGRRALRLVRTASALAVAA